MGFVVHTSAFTAHSSAIPILLFFFFLLQFLGGNLFMIAFYILFLFLNSLVITCHSILGIMGKIVVPRKKEGKNYSILLVNAFL